MTTPLSTALARINAFHPRTDSDIDVFLEREQNILNYTSWVTNLGRLIPHVQTTISDRLTGQPQLYFMKRYITLYEAVWAKRIATDLEDHTLFWSEKIQKDIKNMSYQRPDLPPLSNVLREAVLHRYALLDYAQAKRHILPCNRYLSSEQYSTITKWLEGVTVELAKENPSPAAQTALQHLTAALPRTNM